VDARRSGLAQIGWSCAEGVAALVGYVKAFRGEDESPMTDIPLPAPGQMLLGLDQACYAEALTCFEQALSLREGKGDLELIESTMWAIGVVRGRGV
jgi:hypothetical protein